MTVSTLSPIEPRCTGRCGALATRPPSRSNTAQEKSSRSLMFTDCAVLASAAPICSAIDMNRLLNTSSITGSACVPIASGARPRLDAAESSRSRRSVDLRPPAGLDDRRRVGLDDDGRAVDRGRPPAALRDPRRACRAIRRRTSACTSSTGIGGASEPRALGADVASPLSPTPIASADSASTISGRPGMKKPKRWRCMASNAAVISSAAANATSSGVSVP